MYNPIHFLPPPPFTVQSVPARTRLGQNLGLKFKELGYTGDAGYNNFLYPSPNDTRRMLMWLVSKLPKSEEEGTEEVLGAGAILHRSIHAELKTWEEGLWKVHFCGYGLSATFRTCPLLVPTEEKAGRSDALKAFYSSKYLSFVTDQAPNPGMIGNSLLETNAIGTHSNADREADLQSGTTGAKKAEYLKSYIAQAFAATRQAGTKKDGEEGNGNEDDAAGSGISGVGQVGSLADVLASMKASEGGAESLGRFAHVTAFGHEAAVANAEVARIAAQQMQATEEEKRIAVELALKEEADAESIREEELAEMQRKLDELVAAELGLQKLAEGDVSSMRQLENQLAATLAKTDELEKAYLVQKKALEMLPDAQSNIAKLQDICGKSAERLVELGTEWESHRVPLVASLRKHKEGLSVRKETCRKMVEEMKSMREEMKGMASQVREKEERFELLKAEFQRMPKNINRIQYTYRIMDIIKQIKKQNVEIEKIIGDIRQVQKDINSVGERLKRTETVADERMFKAANAANKDEAHVKSYKLLAEMRATFEQLVEAVTEAGKADTTIRDLESKIEQLTQRLSSNNIDQIEKDLAQVKEDSQKLVKKLKS